MKKSMRWLTSLCVGVCLSVTAHAGERRDAVVGAIIGASAGAVIGHSLNGRDGAVIGSALGAMTGAAVATSDNSREVSRPIVYERERYPVRQRVIVREPAPRVIIVRDHHHGPRHHWQRSWADRSSYGSYSYYERDADDRYDRHDRWH